MTLPVANLPLTNPTPGTADRANHLDRQRLREAAHHAKRRYPGPVGELIAAELLVWEGFGFRFGGAGPITRLVDHLTTQEL